VKRFTDAEPSSAPRLTEDVDGVSLFSAGIGTTVYFHRSYAHTVKNAALLVRPAENSDEDWLNRAGFAGDSNL
jgi:hypothetical protein